MNKYLLCCELFLQVLKHSLTPLRFRKWIHFKWTLRECFGLNRKTRYIVWFTKQVFIRNYIINGEFPEQSELVRSIRNKMDYNDNFEYRMLKSGR